MALSKKERLAKEIESALRHIRTCGGKNCEEAEEHLNEALSINNEPVEISPPPTRHRKEKSRLLGEEVLGGESGERTMKAVLKT
jgi:hypothetical protein